MRSALVLDGRLRVTDEGDVYRIKKDIELLAIAHERHIKNEYVHVSCGGRNDRETFMVHRLVAMAFIPNPNDYPYINHLDGQKNNNRVSNLEWCTAEQNARHALKTGLRIPKCGRRIAAPGKKPLRVSVVLPPELEKALYDLRKTDTYCRMSLSEIVRVYFEKGLSQDAAPAKKKGA